MHILTDETACIVVLLAAGIGEGKELVKAVDKGFLATHQTNEVLYILWHIPVVLPSIALGIRIAAIGTIAQWVEWLQPLAITVLALEESIGWIEEVAIILAALHKALVDIFLTEFLGKLCHAPIIEGLFQGDGYRLRQNVLWHITIFLPCLEIRAQVGTGAGGKHCIQHSLAIHSLELSFEVSIHNHWHSMVAYHAVVVLTIEMPNR